MYELEPCHIYLRGSGATPLSGLKEYEAYGLTGGAFFFEAFDEATLWASEAKEDVVAAAFIFNPYECCGPEGEVVARANAYELLYYFEAVCGEVGLGVILHAEVVAQEVFYGAGLH